MEDIIIDPIEVAKTLENIPTITPDRMHCPICFSPMIPISAQLYYCDYCNSVGNVTGRTKEGKMLWG